MTCTQDSITGLIQRVTSATKHPKQDTTALQSEIAQSLARVSRRSTSFSATNGANRELLRALVQARRSDWLSIGSNAWIAQLTEIANASYHDGALDAATEEAVLKVLQAWLVKTIKDEAAVPKDLIGSSTDDLLFFPPSRLP